MILIDVIEEHEPPPPPEDPEFPETPDCLCEPRSLALSTVDTNPFIEVIFCQDCGDSGYFDQWVRLRR